MAPPLRLSKSIPILRLEEASDSSSDSEDSGLEISQHHSNKLSLPLRSIPSSLTLPHLRPKSSKAYVAPPRSSLSASASPAPTPPAPAADPTAWDPSTSLSALHAALLGAHDRGAPLPAALHGPLLRLLELTRGLVAAQTGAAAAAEERAQRAAAHVAAAMEEDFDARRDVYLGEIARLERELRRVVGGAEARRVRARTLLRGDLALRSGAARERRARLWRGGWDLRDEESAEYAAGGDLRDDSGPEMVGDVETSLGKRRRHDDGDSGFAHANGRVGFDAIRVMESQQQLDAGRRCEDRNTLITDDDMLRRSESSQPRSGAVRSVDSQATLVAGHHNDSAHVRFANDRRSRPIANVHRSKSTIRPIESGENLDPQNEYPRSRFSFIEGDDAEGRVTQRSSLASLRRTESQETLVQRGSIDDMVGRLAQAGFK